MDNINDINKNQQPPCYPAETRAIPPENCSDSDAPALSLEAAHWTRLALYIAWAQGRLAYHRQWHDTTRLSCLWHLQQLETFMGLTPPAPNTRFDIPDTQWRIERLKSKRQLIFSRLKSRTLPQSSVHKDVTSIALGLDAICKLPSNAPRTIESPSLLATGLAYASGLYGIKLPDEVSSLEGPAKLTGAYSLELLGRWLQAIEMDAWSPPQALSSTAPMGFGHGAQPSMPSSQGPPPRPTASNARQQSTLLRTGSLSSSCSSSSTVGKSRLRRLLWTVTCGLVGKM
jgi:hypothetical protein